MHCDWCDTPHSIGDTTKAFDQYTVDELMEKIMAVNEKMFGANDVSRMVKDKTRRHVAIWLEIFRDVRSQWTEAEHGKSHGSKF